MAAWLPIHLRIANSASASAPNTTSPPKAPSPPASVSSGESVYSNVSPDWVPMHLRVTRSPSPTPTPSPTPAKVIKVAPDYVPVHLRIANATDAPKTPATSTPGFSTTPVSPKATLPPVEVALAQEATAKLTSSLDANPVCAPKANTGPKVSGGVASWNAVTENVEPVLEVKSGAGAALNAKLGLGSPSASSVSSGRSVLPPSPPQGGGIARTKSAFKSYAPPTKLQTRATSKPQVQVNRAAAIPIVAPPKPQPQVQASHLAAIPIKAPPKPQVEASSASTVKVIAPPKSQVQANGNTTTFTIVKTIKTTTAPVVKPAQAAPPKNLPPPIAQALQAHTSHAATPPITKPGLKSSKWAIKSAKTVAPLKIDTKVVQPQAPTQRKDSAVTETFSSDAQKLRGSSPPFKPKSHAIEVTATISQVTKSAPIETLKLSAQSPPFRPKVETPPSSVVDTSSLETTKLAANTPSCKAQGKTVTSPATTPSNTDTISPEISKPSATTPSSEPPVSASAEQTLLSNPKLNGPVAVEKSVPAKLSKLVAGTAVASPMTKSPPPANAPVASEKVTTHAPLHIGGVKISQYSTAPPPRNVKKTVTFDAAIPPSSSDSFSLDTSLIAAKSEPTTPPTEHTQATEQYAMAFHKYNQNKSLKAPRVPKMQRGPMPSGWLTKDEKKAMAARNDMTDEEAARQAYLDGGWGEMPEIDWNGASQLVDWEGNILPAPVEWDGRRTCNRDNWCDFIVKFIHECAPYYFQMKNPSPEGPNDKYIYVSKLIIDMTSPVFFDDEDRHELGEIVPREWIADKIENQTLQSFWNSLKQQIVPAPVDEEDLNDNPFWRRFAHNTNTLEPLRHPDARCEPMELPENATADEQDDHRLWKQSREQTANLSVLQYLDKVNGVTEEKARRRAEKAAKHTKAKEPPKIIKPPNPHRPKANIYLRPMSIRRDIDGIHEIYKHHADTTVAVNELEAKSHSDYLRFLEAVQATGLPMLVAVERSGLKEKRRHQPHHRQVQESILGFAYAENLGSRDTQMSYLANINILVNAEHQSKGIGKNMLDRLLWLLDPTYRVQSDVLWDVDPDDMMYTTPGGKTMIGAARVNMIYGEDEDKKCAWVNEWLKTFGFQKQADFGRCGIKLGKWTKLAVWQRHCDQSLDPKTAIRS